MQTELLSNLLFSACPLFSHGPWSTPGLSRSMCLLHVVRRSNKNLVTRSFPVLTPWFGKLSFLSLSEHSSTWMKFLGPHMTQEVRFLEYFSSCISRCLHCWSQQNVRACPHWYTWIHVTLRIASILSVIACVLDQGLHIALYVPTSSLVNIIPKSTRNRTGIRARRGKSCVLA